MQPNNKPKFSYGIKCKLCYMQPIRNAKYSHWRIQNWSFPRSNGHIILNLDAYKCDSVRVCVFDDVTFIANDMCCIALLPIAFNERIYVLHTLRTLQHSIRFDLHWNRCILDLELHSSSIWSSSALCSVFGVRWTVIVIVAVLVCRWG